MTDEIIPEKEEVSIEKDKGALIPAESKEGKKKDGSFFPIVLVSIASLVIATCWDKIAVIKDSVHAVLDPSAGLLLGLNVEVGMIIIVAIITLLTTLVQKYTTDQKALRELKEEQKILQAEMKKYENHPEKIAELSKQQFKFIPRTFKLTSRYILFTGIPFILFFRWFNDYFLTLEQSLGETVLFFGFFNWFWFYFIATMVFSSILRKILKVV